MPASRIRARKAFSSSDCVHGAGPRISPIAALSSFTPRRPRLRPNSSLKLVHVEEVAALSRLERKSKLLGPRHLRIVEERAVDGGDRNPVDFGAVTFVEPSHAVDSDPFPAALRPSGNADIDRAAGGWAELPEHDRVPVTEDCFRPAREHCGEPPPLQRDPAVANRINAAVQAMELTPRDPILDRITGEPKNHQLPPRNHTMPKPSERREQLITWST
jgi:hypothetical protein